MGDCKRRRNRVCSFSRDGSQRRELHKWTQLGKKIRRRLGVFLRTCVVTVSPGFHLVLVYASYRQCGKDVNQKKCVLKYTKLSETHERKITLYRQYVGRFCHLHCVMIILSFFCFHVCLFLFLRALVCVCVCVCV